MKHDGVRPSGTPYDESSHVSAEAGEVMVDRPDGVAVSMTPEAALETGERLNAAAIEAAGQRRLGETSDQNG